MAMSMFTEVGARMVSAAFVLVAWKTLFSLLTCVMTVALVYEFYKDYFSSCFDLQARWMQVGVTDFSIRISFIAAWFFYKESRWILRVAFVFLLFLLGSVTICGYILVLFFKLSPEETSKDPIYFVLASVKNRRTGRASVVTTRVIYASLGCLMLGLLVFACITDGSPFRAQVLSPCMVTLVTDVCIQAVVFSVWVAYKESSWINAFFWILLVVFFGSITQCAFIVRELFYLSPEQPVYLILFNRSNRDIISGDPPLMEYANQPMYK